jgi:hypothetical protein
MANRFADCEVSGVQFLVANDTLSDQMVLKRSFNLQLTLNDTMSVKTRHFPIDYTRRIFQNNNNRPLDSTKPQELPS